VAAGATSGRPTFWSSAVGDDSLVSFPAAPPLVTAATVAVVVADSAEDGEGPPENIRSTSGSQK